MGKSRELLCWSLSAVLSYPAADQDGLHSLSRRTHCWASFVLAVVFTGQERHLEMWKDQERSEACVALTIMSSLVYEGLLSPPHLYRLTPS